MHVPRMMQNFIYLHKSCTILFNHIFLENMQKCLKKQLLLINIVHLSNNKYNKQCSLMLEHVCTYSLKRFDRLIYIFIFSYLLIYSAVCLINFCQPTTQRSRVHTIFSFRRKKLYPSSSKCNAKRKKGKETRTKSNRTKFLLPN